MAFTSNFIWTKPVNIDREFSYTKIINSVAGDYFQNTSVDTVPGVYNVGKTLHPEFKMFYKGPSNYVGVCGRIMSLNIWTEEQDADVDYLQKNISSSPLEFQYLMENINFDWTNRIFSRVLNFNKAPKNQWLDADQFWGFDGAIRNEAIDDNSSLACIMYRELGHWTSKTNTMLAGDSTTYEKTESIAYVFVLKGEATINGVALTENAILKISSSVLTIEATTDCVIAVKEKHNVA